MKTLTDQLQSVSKFLVNLSKQVEKIAKQVEKRTPAKTTQTKAKPGAAKKGPAKKAPAKKAASKKAADKQATVLDTIYDIIKKSKKGVTTATLKEKTGLQSKQISNALYKLSKRDMIQSVSRGVYVKK